MDTKIKKNWLAASIKCLQKAFHAAGFLLRRWFHARLNDEVGQAKAAKKKGKEDLPFATMASRGKVSRNDHGEAAGTV